MLSFVRRLLNSKLGVPLTLGFLALLAVAFVLGDVTGRGNGGGRTATGDNAATVGKVSITEEELKRNVQGELRAFQRDRPGLDMAQFIAGGAIEGTLERMINAVALDLFGKKNGMTVSKRAIDAQILAIPGFNGLDGKFSEQAYQRALGSAGLTSEKFREELRRETVARQLTGPTEGASQVPNRLALPYASLLLEKRAGMLAVVPTAAVGLGAPPSEQEVTAYYTRNLARYVVPERRTIRYALVSAEALKAQAAPTEAEIANAFKAKAASYAARETRTISQIVIASKASADTLAAKIRGGLAIDAAARSVGLEAATLNALDKAGYADQTSEDAATSAFGAAKGATIGPVKAPLGWIVAHIDAVDQLAAKTLAQVRPDIVKELTDQKLTALEVAQRGKVDAALNANATFDEIVAGQKLTAALTPPLLADGRDATQPAATPSPTMVPLASAGFQAEPGDQPQMIPIGTDGSFALVSVDRITPAAAPPLGDIRAAVARDFQIDRASRSARKIAVEIVAKINKGKALTAALAEAGLKLPPANPIKASRAELAAAQQRVPPPLALMFSMTGKTAKLLEAPNNGGWLIVYLDTIVKGDASNQPGVVFAMRGDLGRNFGREYVAQFTTAIRRDIGVSKNSTAIAKARGDLTGNGGGQP